MGLDRITRSVLKDVDRPGVGSCVFGCFLDEVGVVVAEGKVVRVTEADFSWRLVWINRDG